MIIGTQRHEIDELTANYNKLKRKVTGCGEVLAEHSRKMLQYEEKLTAAKEKVEAKRLEHDEYEDDDEIAYKITTSDSATLDAYPLFKKCDRQFVSASLVILYKDNLTELENRVLKKTKSCSARSKVISPKKLQKIFSLMHERASKIRDPEEQLDRVQKKYMRSIISKALHYQKNI